MLIDSLNLNQLRIFECVYRTRSMTTSAHELHLTQSGVSQHIKSLEDVLGVKLFDRIKQRLVPTDTANMLFKKCSESLYGLEQVLSEIKGGERKLSGTVNIGMPIEFGNNLVLPLLAKFCKQHPRAKFAFRYGFATEMNKQLLSGELDFAFVDAFGLDSQIKTQAVYDEVLDLCAAPEFLKRAGAQGSAKDTRNYFESLEYVDYQAGEPLLRMWFDHHLGTKRLDLNVRATMMDVQGVARLILTGIVAGVLPEHLILTLERDGRKFHRFKGCGRPLKNRISVAYLPERTQSLLSATVFKWLLDSFKSSGQ